jgi:hypothetical protein
MHPCESRKINYGEEVLNTIETINRKRTPNVAMKQIKDFIGYEITYRKRQAMLLSQWTNCTTIIGINKMLESY